MFPGCHDNLSLKACVGGSCDQDEAVNICFIRSSSNPVLHPLDSFTGSLDRIQWERLLYVPGGLRERLWLQRSTDGRPHNEAGKSAAPKTTTNHSELIYSLWDYVLITKG